MKQETRTIQIALLTTALSLLLVKGQAQVIQQVQNSFNLYQQNAFIEKIFAHTDKDIYLPGELLWFKIYCLDGNDHTPANLSKVAYIDVLDNNQAAIIQGKVSIQNGAGSGSLYIPVSVSSGSYKLRVYTSWMKNFSPDYYFEKNITLINPLKSPESSKKEVPLAFDIRFFPEGGNLVGDVTSKVAFKAVGQNGKSLAIRGVIVDQRNDTVARFGSLKFGMGSFSFTPALNNSYKALVDAGNGLHQTKELPQVKDRGYVMSLSDDGSGTIQVKVKTNTKDGNVYLFAHSRQEVKVAESALVDNGTATFTIRKSILGEGISHFTVFNNAKQPVCERLYFKRPQQQLFIEAGADRPQYGLRKAVNIAIQARDAASKPVNADLSMSVYRVDSLQQADKTDIFSYLWLRSDLRGFIESPAYYFTNVNAETDQALDNLMLTQGWRRFDWKQMLSDTRPAFAYLPEINGHVIAGRIFNIAGGTPAKNVVTYLGIPGKRVQLYTAYSDSLGRLLYATKDFFGPNEIIAQTNQQVDSTYRIDILTPFSEQYSKTVWPAFNFTSSMTEALKQHSLGVQVTNIYSGNKIKQFYEPAVDSSAFFGRPFKTYKLDDFVRFATMEEDLREYVSEDNVVKQKGHFHIRVLSGGGFLDGDPLVLLDGIPVFNIDKVFVLDPLKVQKLDVVPFRYYYGPSEQEGIFSFTTYKGDFAGLELDPHALVVDYEGLQLHREFYSPVYNSDAQVASRIPDFRNLLFWSPSVGATGKNAVSFYTSDLAGKYIGVVEGITASGNAASGYFTFEVK